MSGSKDVVMAMDERPAASSSEKPPTGGVQQDRLIQSEERHYAHELVNIVVDGLNAMQGTWPPVSEPLKLQPGENWLRLAPITSSSTPENSVHAEYPSKHCYVCIDVDGQLAAIKDMRPRMTECTGEPEICLSRRMRKRDYPGTAGTAIEKQGGTEVGYDSDDENEGDDYVSGKTKQRKKFYPLEPLPRRQMRILHQGDRIIVQQRDDGNLKVGVALEYRQHLALQGRVNWESKRAGAVNASESGSRSSSTGAAVIVGIDTGPSKAKVSTPKETKAVKNFIYYPEGERARSVDDETDNASYLTGEVLMGDQGYVSAITGDGMESEARRDRPQQRIPKEITKVDRQTQNEVENSTRNENEAAIVGVADKGEEAQDGRKLTQEKEEDIPSEAAVSPPKPHTTPMDVDNNDESSSSPMEEEDEDEEEEGEPTQAFPMPMGLSTQQSQENEAVSDDDIANGLEPIDEADVIKRSLEDPTQLPPDPYDEPTQPLILPPNADYKHDHASDHAECSEENKKKKSDTDREVNGVTRTAATGDESSCSDSSRALLEETDNDTRHVDAANQKTNGRDKSAGTNADYELDPELSPQEGGEHFDYGDELQNDGGERDAEAAINGQAIGTLNSVHQVSSGAMMTGPVGAADRMKSTSPGMQIMLPSHLKQTPQNIRGVADVKPVTEQEGNAALTTTPGSETTAGSNVDVLPDDSARKVASVEEKPERTPHETAAAEDGSPKVASVKTNIEATPLSPDKESALPHASPPLPPAVDTSAGKQTASQSSKTHHESEQPNESRDPMAQAGDSEPIASSVRRDDEGPSALATSSPPDEEIALPESQPSLPPAGESQSSAEEAESELPNEETAETRQAGDASKEVTPLSPDEEVVLPESQHALPPAGEPQSCAKKVESELPNEEITETRQAGDASKEGTPLSPDEEVVMPESQPSLPSAGESQSSAKEVESELPNEETAETQHAGDTSKEGTPLSPDTQPSLPPAEESQSSTKKAEPEHPNETPDQLAQSAEPSTVGEGSVPMRTDEEGPSASATSLSPDKVVPPPQTQPALPRPGVSTRKEISSQSSQKQVDSEQPDGIPVPTPQAVEPSPPEEMEEANVDTEQQQVSSPDGGNVNSEGKNNENIHVASPSSPPLKKRTRAASAEKPAPKRQKHHEDVMNADDGIRVLTTGVKTTSRHKQMVERIGGVLLEKVEDASQATHVIAGDDETPLRRTPKLMIGLCRTSNIVHLDWLVKSARARRALDCNKFLLLNDEPAEEKYDFSMKETLENGDKLRRQGEHLLDGWYVYVCKGVAGNKAPPANELRLIVDAAGGEWLSSVSASTLKHIEPTRVLVITSDPAVKKQLSARDVAKVLKLGGRQGTTSWLFHCMITQQFQL